MADAPQSLQSWRNSSVLSTTGWSPARVIPLLDLAARYKQARQRNELIQSEGYHACLTVFYEPSTRTRLSFESAANQLGVKVSTVANAMNDSSAKKGETLEDMGKILSGYANVLIIRHPELGAARRLAQTATVPVINAGDGAGEHPTQALVDLFTIREAFGTLQGLRVGLCGDLLNGRTVHSLLRLLIECGCKLVAIAPDEMAIPRETLLKIPHAADAITVNPDLRAVLPQLDVLYMTRVQKERFHDLELYESVKKSYRLTRADLQSAPSTLKVLHPLPRVDEIATEVDEDPRALYFAQSANGVPVRMALLSAILGLRNQIHTGVQ